MQMLEMNVKVMESMPKPEWADRLAAELKAGLKQQELEVKIEQVQT